MQRNPTPIARHSVRGESRRRGLRVILDTARRSKGLWLAAAAVFAFSACASLPPSDSNATNANACVGPVSYCNIFFGS
ncbi:hypothetical protein LMG29542_02574 [Paraburkholderia humisilvae]|uniref:Uncharacterized protein n=1 Tax=Paraburkholderia humisilvae TaxID=627669 RepID=A0A6J5DPD4_9BURK|nr:hypothetical protein LMG29542_02574 [Paraburkholderia humisilvae]